MNNTPPAQIASHRAPAPRPSRATVVLVLLLIGCGERPEVADGMIPDSPSARRAIDVAMASWKAGRPTGRVESTAPQVLVADTMRTAGQALDRYEILGDTVSGKTRDITVRVHLLHPEKTEILRFKIVGIDPVVVFREENYDMLAHWDHDMMAAPNGAKPESGEPATEERP